MKIKIFILIILAFLPLISAGAYGAGAYGSGSYGIGETTTPAATTPAASGGAGGLPSLQFDVKILEIDSSLALGKPFNFNYYVKGVGSFNHDVNIDFSLEENGEVISSGTDAIYFGTNEEKNETASLFLPNNVTSGTYELKVKASYGSASGESHRTVYLNVENGVAKVEQLLDISLFLEKSVMENSDDLTAVATFENFGTAPAEVNLTYSILDEQGRKVYAEKGNITIQTEEVLRKNFAGLNLPEGDYTFVLETLYGNNVYDKFQQSFEIKRFSIRDFYESYKYYIFSAAGFFIVLILIIILIKKHKKKRPQKKNSKNVSDYKKKIKQRLNRIRK